MNKEISERYKRKHLVKIIKNYLETGKSLMEYYHSVADERKVKLICTKAIKKIEEAKTFVESIKHIELLEYIYSSFVGNNVFAYSTSGTFLLSKQIKSYDTDEGFEVFKEIIEEKKQEALEKEKKKQESIDAIKKAKQMGKKVEMVYDKESKTLKPLIIDNKK